MTNEPHQVDTPRTRIQRGLRATRIGMVANTGLASGKIVTGLLGRSQALVADGIESLADLFSSMIVWRGLVLSATPADDDHPYGHGKAEPLAAAMVSTLLLLAAVVICVSAAWELAHPHGAPAWYTLVVLVAVVAVKEGLFRFVLREAVAVESTAVRSDAWHHRSDAITSVAAGIGISVALVGGPGYELADDVAAILASGIIAANGIRLLRLSAHELMDASPDRAFVEQVERLGASVPGVVHIEKCRVRKTGVHYLVDMHVEVNGDMPVRDAHAIAHRVKDLIRRELPPVMDVLVHVEPATGETGYEM